MECKKKNSKHGYMKYLLIFFFFTSLYPELSKDELLGKINVKNHPDFTNIKSNGEIFWLRKEVAVKYLEMANQAEKDGIKLYIISAFRSFEDQKKIWQYKMKKYSSLPREERIKKILQYFTVPGTSRHHWGTEIDLVSDNPKFFKTIQGQKIFNWLTNNAPWYGFFLPYASGRTNGIKEEKWHWSYKPLSEKYLIEYTNKIKYEDLDGFFDPKFLEKLNLFENYILNISQN